MKSGVTRKEFMVTRRSLVERLADWDDQKNWQEFFDTYWRLIYGVARKAGLTEAEAHDVVQETIITVAKKVGKLRYDPARGSFKGWLLQTTRWRIADQFRKRQADVVTTKRRTDETRRTATIDRVPDPAGVDLDDEWETAWQRNLVEAALERMKQKVDLKQFQIFDCYVMREWPVRKVASALGVSAGQVYLVKHRLSALLKKEVRAVERIGTVRRK
jgi:RNA polymerase sigma-70 factor (ECF subfamily)